MAAGPAVQNAAAQGPVVLRIGFLAGIESLNPFQGINDADYLLYGLLYDYLFALDEDGNAEPNIAVDAVADAYGANWTYTIRQGVKWHDGSDLTLGDVVFSINKNLENFFLLWAYEPYVNRIVQCSAQTEPYCGAKVTDPDAWEITVYFDRPFVPGKQLYLPIIQEAQWGGVSANQIQCCYENLNPIGTGLFMADPQMGEQWQQGQPLLLHKNPDYHLGVSALDSIYLETFADEATMVSAILTGAIDVAEFTPAGYEVLAGAADIERQEFLVSTQYWVEVGFQQYDTQSVNLGLNPARWDQNVRRALAMATNKDFIVQTIYQGKGVRGSTLMSPITPQWHYDPAQDSNVNLTYNIAAANALLDAAGYDTIGTDGIRVASQDIQVREDGGAGGADPFAPSQTKTVPAGTRLSFDMGVRQEYVQEQNTAQYLQAAWAQVGVELNYQVMLEPALSDAVYGGDVETYIWYWSGDPDPNYLLSIQSGFTLDGWSDNFWNNATYNQLYVDHLAAKDPTEREQIVREALKLHYESAVYLILIYTVGTWAYRTDQFIGWGDWAAHPYRQLNAFWTAPPLFLDLRPAPANNCPTKPVIGGTSSITTFVGQEQGFVAEASDPDANALTWTWDWDDGSTSTNSTAGAPGTVTVATSHTWTATGTYSVSVAVDDTICVVQSDPVEVVVMEPPAEAGTISGTVTDASTGDPIPNAVVSTSPGGFADTTGTDGSYSIVSVPVGTYSVTATASLYASQTEEDVVVTQDETTDVDFALSPLRGWIVGTVTSSAGDPLPGTAVVVSGPQQTSGQTDSAGRYNITVVPGTYTVQASLAGYVSQNRTGIQVVADQATQVDFVLQPVPQPGINLVALGAGLGVALVIIATIAVIAMRRSRERREREAPLPPPPPQP
jgi:peptide/nickel transport system substrate-binding protein